VITALLPFKDSQPEMFKSGRDALFTQNLQLTETKTEATKVEQKPGNKCEETRVKENKPTEIETKTETEAQDIEEVIAVCIDVSGSMNTPFESQDDNPLVISRPRLAAVKQMFYGFRDQTSNFKQSKHLLGLISYDHRVSVHTNPTNNFDCFEDVVDDMECGGSTAIYESISVGCGMLKRFKSLHPNADLRVLCLTDGANNCHKVTASDALRELNEIGAVCDCIIVGNSPDTDLLKLVTATEGSCYQITSLAEGYECLESEAVISLLARRNGAPKPEFKKRVSSIDNVSQASVHKGGYVVKTASTVKNPQPIQQVLASDAKNMSGSACTKRVLKELRAFQATQDDPLLDLFEVFPDVQDGKVESIKVLMHGKEHTPYHKGIFEISYQFPSNYPFSPPIVRVVTPMYHYAVNTQGGICLDILKDAWSPALNLNKVLSTLGQMLMDSDSFDPDCVYSIRSWLSELKRVNPKDYNREAEKFTLQHAIP